MKTMEHKLLTYLLDGGSVSAFFFGWFSGQDILMFLGACASIAAIINHSSQWYDRHRNKRQK